MWLNGVWYPYVPQPCFWYVVDPTLSNRIAELEKRIETLEKRQK